MPIIKSAIKRVRQTVKRRSHNLQVKRAIISDIRAVTDAVTAGDTKTASTALSAAYSEIDRGVKKGTLHRNTAARRKSQLARAVATLGIAAQSPQSADRKSKPSTPATKATKTKAVKPASKTATKRPTKAATKPSS